MNEEFPKIGKAAEANSSVMLKELLTQTHHEQRTHLSQNNTAQFSGRSRISQTVKDRQTLSLEQNPITLQDFAENCMKMREIGQRGMHVLVI